MAFFYLTAKRLIFTLPGFLQRPDMGIMLAIPQTHGLSEPLYQASGLIEIECLVAV